MSLVSSCNWDDPYCGVSRQVSSGKIILQSLSLFTLALLDYG